MTDQRTLKNIITEQRKQINTMILQRREANKILDDITEGWQDHVLIKKIVTAEDLQRLRMCLSQEQKNPCPYGATPYNEQCKAIKDCNGECHPNYGQGSSIANESTKKEQL
jgi:hypothetical protein